MLLVCKHPPTPNALATAHFFFFTMFWAFPERRISGIIQYVAFKFGCFCVGPVSNDFFFLSFLCNKTIPRFWELSLPLFHNLGRREQSGKRKVPRTAAILVRRPTLSPLRAESELRATWFNPFIMQLRELGSSTEGLWQSQGKNSISWLQMQFSFDFTSSSAVMWSFS